MKLTRQCVYESNLCALDSVEVQHFARFSVLHLDDAVLAQVLTSVLSNLVTSLCRAVTALHICTTSMQLVIT